MRSFVSISDFWHPKTMIVEDIQESQGHKSSKTTEIDTYSPWTI